MDPPWTPDRMTEDARDQLGNLLIAADVCHLAALAASSTVSIAMHFFLYEWCSGGGLVNEPGAALLARPRRRDDGWRAGGRLDSNSQGRVFLLSAIHA